MSVGDVVMEGGLRAAKTAVRWAEGGAGRVASSAGSVADVVRGGVRRGAGGRFESDGVAYARWLENSAARAPTVRASSGIATMDPVQRRLAEMEGYKVSEFRNRTPGERNMDRIRDRKQTTMAANQRVHAGTAAGAGMAPPPGGPPGGAIGPKPDGRSFWETSNMHGWQHMAGGAALGGAVGGASAWMTGGSVGQGIMMGGMLGAVGGAYNHQIHTGTGEAMMEGGRAISGLRHGQQGPLTANGARLAGAGHGIVQGAASSRAAMMAAGGGLVGGAFLSGHKRKPMNGYNGRRGNYIGG